MGAVERTHTFNSEQMPTGNDAETEFSGIYDAWNNHNSGTQKWRVVSALNASAAPLIADNSTGTNDIVQFKDNGSTVWSIADGGNLVSATKKITGLAAATANGEAVRYEQLIFGFQAPVITTTSTTSSTTSSTYQNSNLSVAITPTSSSHRIMIWVGTNLLSAVTTNAVQVSLFRGSTDLGGSNGFANFTPWANNQLVPFSAVWIDSPATTSSTTYMLKLKSIDNTNSVSVIAGETSSIVVAEIV